MEILLHHIVYGKPKETLALQAAGDGVLILNIGGQEKVSLEVGPDGMAKRKEITEVTLALPEKTSEVAID